MATIFVQLLIGLGGMLLTALFTPKPKDQYGSRLSDINVTPVNPGNIIPRVWGTMKVPAQMVFCSPLIETMHTHQASKKGGKGSLFGGAAKSYTYTYSIDAAWGVCLGPVYQVNRIWANQKLLYVNPVVQAHAQADFDAAYQAEATRLIDEEGVQLDYAAASAFVFAFNNYDTTEVTLQSPTDAVNYIMAHPIDDTTGIYGAILTPDSAGVTAVIVQLYSGLNNQLQYQSQINRFDLMEVYLGDELQAPNGLLQGYLGMGNAPSFRGACYFVITNLQLMDFGNSVPSFTVEIQRTPNGTTSLVEVLTDVCYQAGLLDGQFDCISNVDPTPFPGFCITTNTSARQIIQDLQKVFPIDAAESGYQIVFSMLNSRASQILNRSDFAAHVDSDAVPDTEEVTRVSDYDLPYRINFKYQEPARNYSLNMLYAFRTNTPSLSVEEIEVTVALDRTTAQTTVNNTLANRMFARKAYKLRLPRKYITMEPTDVVKIPNKVNPTFLQEYYVTETNVGANGILEVQLIDHMYVDPLLKPSAPTSVDIASATSGPTSLPGTSATLAFMLDTPLLSDGDADTPGFYTVLAGLYNEWQGGSLYVDAATASIANAYGVAIVTPAAGSAWEMVASSSINVPQGVVLNALAPKMHACYFDRLSVLTVHIFNAMDLLSASESDLLIQSLNATYIGGEIVQYATAVNLGNGMWRLSNFLRGARGTEHMINGHAPGEKFVRLTGALNRVPTTKAELNSNDSFQAVSINSTIAPTGFSFTDTGNSCKPYTVKVYEKFRNVDGDVSIAWWPRVRQGGQWLSGADVTIPAKDMPETYSVDVLRSDKVTVVNTFTIVGALGGSLTYTAAQQTTDFGSPHGAINFAIYQISTVVGRGFGVGVTV